MNTTNLLIVAVGFAIVYLAATKLGIIPDLTKLAGVDDASAT